MLGAYAGTVGRSLPAFTPRKDSLMSATHLSIHPRGEDALLATVVRSLETVVALSIEFDGSDVTYFLEFGTLEGAAEQLRQAAAALEGLELAERNRRRAAAVRRLRESVSA